MISIPLRAPRWRVELARLLQTIGWAGVGGMALMAVALILAWLAWSKYDRLPVESSIDRQRPSSSHTAPAPQEPAFPKLAVRAEVPLILSRIARAATNSGLTWTAAEYRLVPSSDRQAGALEVRCAFKAPYPKLRSMVAEVLGLAPAVTFREMSFSRSGIDVPDVDARFAIVVPLADDESTPPAVAR